MGLDDSSLRAFLTNLSGLSREWQARVNDLARSAADGMVTEVRSTYPERSGNLRRGLATVLGTSGPSVKVRSGAPHAHLYEFGTRDRFDRTKRTPAYRGAMPRANVFIPAAMRHRRTFLDVCQDLANEPKEL